MQTADEFYLEYLAWCTSVNLDKRAILTPRQYELQIMAFLPAKHERSESEALASSDDRSVPSKC